MVIVSDTTPIISLLKLNQLKLLEKLYKTIVIPNAVYEELTTNKTFEEEAERIKEVPYIRRETVKDINRLREFQRRTKLDNGESEAIMLYIEQKATLLLMDERKGRRYAKEAGCSVMGTMGILIKSVYEGFLSLEESRKCKALLERSRLRVAPTLIDAFEDAIHDKFGDTI